MSSLCSSHKISHGYPKKYNLKKVIAYFNTNHLKKKCKAKIIVKLFCSRHIDELPFSIYLIQLPKY